MNGHRSASGAAHEPLDEFAALHQDVGGAVAPAGLEAQREPAVAMLLESLAGERWAGDVAAEPFVASPVARGNGDAGFRRAVPANTRSTSSGSGGGRGRKRACPPYSDA